MSEKTNIQGKSIIIILNHATNPSSGQILSIARALLTKPKVLIMDEATSNLDSITEPANDIFYRLQELSAKLNR